MGDHGQIDGGKFELAFATLGLEQFVVVDPTGRPWFVDALGEGGRVQFGEGAL